MAEAVLDSSAALAWFREEAGAEQVAHALPSGMMSSVNLTEVVTRLIDYGHSIEDAERIGRRLPCEIAPYDRALAIQAGVLRSFTRHLGLSLGDRACLALAERERLPVLTADRPWADLDIGVEVRLIR